ncbi:MAG TPA: amino acid adenylation domain-containing protein, partial [Bacteroidales bacterium]|nr:amino acid adenylation domain-containing protein [Bacteroidales bacterium]
MELTENRKLYSLSHAQKRIWYNEAIHLNTPFANLPFTVKYPFEIRFDLLSRAINHVIRTRDGFRLQMVRFEENNLIETRQVVSEFREHNFEILDFSGPGGAARLGEWIAINSGEPFRLYDSDLYYFALMRFSEKEWGYYFKMHHVISDGWTISLAVHLIDQAYQCFLSGNVPVEDPAPSYLEYVEDEKSYLASEKCVQDRTYWLEKMLPLPEEAALSFSKNRTGEIRSSTRIFAFPDSVRTRMQEFSKANRTSVFKLVLSALYIYLNRVTGTDDLAVASVNHGREKPAHKEMAGMFVSTFILRLRLAPEMTFRELVSQAGSLVNDTIRNYARYPVDLLLQELREKSGSDASYLLNVMLVGHPNPDRQEAALQYIFPGNEISPLMIHINASGRDADGVLELQFDFQDDLFREEDVERIFGSLEAILQDGLAGPDKIIREISLVPEPVKNKLLFDFNFNAVGFTGPVFIKDLFEEQVLRTPDKPAVVYKDRVLTYRELNSRANRLARTLRNAGAIPDAIAGILADRSLEMIVSVMAVIKAGCAYVPIDAGYPPERIEYLLENSRSFALLSKKSLVSGIHYSGPMIDLEDEGNYAKDDLNPDTVNKPGDLVYVIYTSGSTGKPKGVMIEHRSLSNFVLWHKDLNHLAEKDNVSKFAAFGFDVTVIEIYPTLISGATLHIIPDDIRLSPLQVNEYFEAHHITAAFLPTQFGEQFIDNIENRSLRWLEVAGEKMRSFRKRPYRILNGYGPTEYTVYTSYFEVDKFYENIPIGKPLWNTRIYILDQFNQLRPVGIPGELCVAGIGIARGYLGRPDLTAEKFIDDPFFPGEKMYRTGDLCRWLPDGNIEYLSRIDFQVKIRGFRVELGEIELAIKSMEGVKDAVVVDRTDESGRKYLCGFVVSGVKIDPARIREKLRIDLPEYMIPPYIGQIDRIPLTPNGKIDRKALPEPDRPAVDATSYLEPSTGTEKALAAIWGTILGMEKIGANDSFFDLGGHSLRAALLQARIQKDFRVQLSLQNIFHNARLKDLASLIDAGTRQDYPRITRIPDAQYYPVASAQKRLYIVDRMENIGITYNIPVVVRIEGMLDPDRLSRAVEMMTERHESLRTSFTIAGGVPVQVVHPKVRIRKILLETDEAGIDRVIREFIRPFDLERPPLFRVGLIRISASSHLFIFDVHHIIFDGWSAGVFLDELWDLYEGRKLLSRKLQFRDFAAWQQAMLQSEGIRKQEKYWLDIFGSTVPVLNLDTVHPRGSSISFDGARLHLEVGEALTSGLRKIAGEEGATLFMLLLTSYSILLSKYSGQEDIVIGIPSSGRTIPEVERMIGMFVNSLPLRTLPAGNKKFREFLQEIRERVLGAYDHQDYQLDDLVEKLGMKRDSSRNPLFDVMFAFRQQGADKTCGGLLIRPWEFDFNITKFDLTIEAIEKEKEIRLEIEYRTGLFDEKFIRDLGAHYLRLLEAIAEHPEATIGEISVLLPEEKKFLLETYNATDADYPRDRTVYELFEDQVAAGPDRIAVVDGNRSETYAG